MTWVLYFAIRIACTDCAGAFDVEVKSYAVVDVVTCRRIEFGLAAGRPLRIDTAQFGLRPATWAKCVRKPPVS